MKVIDRTSSDPRLGLSDVDLLEARSFQALPLVARPRRPTDGLGLAAGIIGALAVGALTFVSLSNRHSAPAPSVTAPAPAPVEPTPAEQDPVVAPPIDMAAAPEDEGVGPMEAAQSQAVPMVLDNTAQRSAAPTASADAAAGETPDGAEAFALNAGAQGSVARAVAPENLSTTIVEGTIIPAVLETALNTDVPGNSRAIVSRDVRSFDGANVLIPRGSRLIGQYRAATSGQSRVSITWSRLIRPDGVSIDLASPAVDASGAAGVAGRTDSHFFQRFGSALLYSLVGALPALANADSPTVVIGTNSVAQTAAGQSPQAGAATPPTIRVPIGTPIQVFTTRDLAFD